tara:strand:+ start:3074 stop:3571 length:498 start_codon:yes stop_codon:yes gene_type:complete
MILDELKNPKLTNQKQTWNFITDQVMGGISTGQFKVDNIENRICYRMTGNVSTKNNGGFIQIRTILNPTINTLNFQGIYVKVLGNTKNYKLHLRTALTIAPWQYYSYSFNSPNSWTIIKAPFTMFEKSNFYQPKKIVGQKIKSLALVAGFQNYESDICLSEIGFY